GWGAKASGLHLLDGQSAENNPSTHAGRVLGEGQANTLVFTVNLGGIRVAVNGEPVIDYEGDFDRLSWPDQWRPPAVERLELIGSESTKFAISKLELTTISDLSNVAGPLSGPPELSNEPVKSPKRRSPSHDRRTLGALINGPEVKAPVPERQELAKAERQARELFSVPLTNATEPDRKQALAEKLIEKAGEAGDASADRYVLLEMARNLAAESGSAKVAAKAANETANWFQADARELQLEAFAKTAKAAASQQQRQELFDAALKLLDEFVGADEFDKASKAAGLAQAAARALKNLQLTKQVAEQKREAERIAKAYLAIREDRARLETNENDPQANAAVGEFYGLTKADWPRALPYLARGDDPAYKALAERDLADPDQAEDEKALADEWWKLAEGEKGPSRKALLKRAGFWYRQAAPFPAGLDKETAEKRLAEIEGDAPAVAAIKYLVDLPEATVIVDKNWLGKGRDDLGNDLKVSGQASPKGLFMPPPDNGFASVTYIVNKKALLFTADVGLSYPNRSSSTPLIFEVWGDGGLLWRSKPIKLGEDIDHCEAPLGKIQLLELRVLCLGSNSGAKAVWVEPRLTLK
ncbi:MAG TPA: NPCBM/NEW2 domain-containing protein, partial [Pirellulales bacterium]|nr:NPCBM/NEW2 domain-containing protein [Pirellulales bacterium]